LALEKDWMSVGKQEEEHESEHSVEKSQNLGVCTLSRKSINTKWANHHLFIGQFGPLFECVCMYASLSHTHCALAPSFPPSLPLSLPVQNRVIQVLRTLPVPRSRP